MSEKPHASQFTGSKLRRLFGLSGSDNHQHVSGPDLASGNPFQDCRRDLMERISAFLIKNNLDITPENLLCAHAAFTGANLRLARKIMERESAHEPITQEWLNSLASPEAAATDNGPDINRLVTKLETSIEAFTHTTRNAHSAANSYGNALAKHVDAIDDGDATGQMLASIAELTKAMLERTRQVEEEMKRSEREANALRVSLAKAQRDAEIDHLTGLPNRRAFELMLEANFREAQKQIEPLCVAFCDIDHFKRVNDTFGHETGDRVIQAIGQTLSRVTNDKCHVARHGGEEFVMLFRGLTKLEAKDKLDDAREALASRHFINRATDEPMGQITFSGGVADVFEFSEPRAALRAADEALYRAKEGGRNRIEMA